MNGIEAELLELHEKLSHAPITPTERRQLMLQAAALDSSLRARRKEMDDLKRQLTGELLMIDRSRSEWIRNEILRVSDAYRRVHREPMGTVSEFDVDMDSVHGADQIQRRLYLLATSQDVHERVIPRTLAMHMAEAMGNSVDIDIAAVRNYEFREYETQIKRGNLEGIPIANLGTGEQQLMILLLDVLMASTPIVQIEEPEAHLHKKLMLRLGKMLTRIVEAHDVDQLFIATHHHAFALAAQYYDVTFDEKNGTQAVLTNRAKAIEHFYEPGPLWEALRSLVSSGLQDNAILFRDEQGNPIRARDVLASINEEGTLAKKFAEEMTKTILLSMREEAEFGES
ncbi:MAG TPA: AAA family ATPase [Polyangium sp.]|nr:AAA family ATPase [Polyangium sp.]